MPISLLVLVVFEYVVRRKQRACCWREREQINWVGSNAVFCRIFSKCPTPTSHGELKAGIVLWPRIVPSALNNSNNKINQDHVRSIIMDGFSMILTSLDHGCLFSFKINHMELVFHFFNVWLPRYFISSCLYNHSPGFNLHLSRMSGFSCLAFLKKIISMIYCDVVFLPQIFITYISCI